MNRLLASGLSPFDARESLNEILNVLWMGVSPVGSMWCVKPSGGSDSNNGTSWSEAFATVTKAITSASAGDVIAVYGTLSEGGVAVNKNDLTFVGAGPSVGSNVWQQSAANQTLITVTGTGCKFLNFRFRIPALDSSGNPMGIVLSGAHYTQIIGCKFQGRTGSLYAIKNVGDTDNVTIKDCEFVYMNTATNGCAIYGMTYAADVVGSGWLIKNCRFNSNTKHIATRLQQSWIVGCTFGDYGLNAAGAAAQTATKIDLSGTRSMHNIVTGNFFSGDYSHAGGYTEGTNDDWAGNFAADAAEDEVSDSCVTTGIPT